MLNFSLNNIQWFDWEWMNEWMEEELNVNKIIIIIVDVYRRYGFWVMLTDYHDDI